MIWQVSGVIDEPGAPEREAIELSWVVLTDQSPVPIYIHAIIAVSPEIEKDFVTDF